MIVWRMVLSLVTSLSFQISRSTCESSLQNAPFMTPRTTMRSSQCKQYWHASSPVRSPPHLGFSFFFATAYLVMEEHSYSRQQTNNETCCRVLDAIIVFNAEKDVQAPLPLQLFLYVPSLFILLSIFVYRSLVLGRTPLEATSLPSTALSSHTTPHLLTWPCFNLPSSYEVETVVSVPEELQDGELRLGLFQPVAIAARRKWRILLPHRQFSSLLFCCCRVLRRRQVMNTRWLWIDVGGCVCNFIVSLPTGHPLQPAPLLL